MDRDEALLDACVDSLLAGEDWRANLRDDRGTDEILPRMEMAEIVLAVARQSPHRPDQHTRTRTWQRVVQRAGAAISLTSVSLAGGGAAPALGFAP
jgi:hypothetical protein